MHALLRLRRNPNRAAADRPGVSADGVKDDGKDIATRDGDWTLEHIPKAWPLHPNGHATRRGRHVLRLLGRFHVMAALSLVHLCVSCGNATTPATMPSTRTDPTTKPAAYVLGPRNGDPASVTFKASREPIRDVRTDVKDGWRSITSSKWMGSNVAYYLAEDLQCPVENQVRTIGDFDFDLRWKVGDVSSMNAALKPYGIEVVPPDSKPTTTQGTAR